MSCGNEAAVEQLKLLLGTSQGLFSLDFCSQRF